VAGERGDLSGDGHVCVSRLALRQVSCA
jgi:hypothetical protein